MRHQQLVDVYFCDSCGKRVVVDDGDLPEGYHGEAYAVDKWGSPSVTAKWYACTEMHIKNAVLAALKQAEQEDGAGSG